MKKVFNVITEAAVSYYDELYHLVMMGAVTFVACLLILPGPFALAGLWYVAHRTVRRSTTSWRDYWDGVKRYGVRAWGILLIVLFGYILIFSNIWFYNTPQISPIDNANIILAMTSLALAMLLLWTCMTFYISTALIEQKTGGIFLAVRNSLYLTFAYPIQTVIWTLFSALILIISLLAPILLILTPAYISVLSFTGFRTLVLPLLEEQEAGEDGPEASVKSAEKARAL